MRIEISGLDRTTLNRARYNLDASGFEWRENERLTVPVSVLSGADVTTPLPAPDISLSFESDDPAALRAFLYAALHDPSARVYR